MLVRGGGTWGDSCKKCGARDGRSFRLSWRCCSCAPVLASPYLRACSRAPSVCAFVLASPCTRARSCRPVYARLPSHLALLALHMLSVHGLAFRVLALRGLAFCALALLGPRFLRTGPFGASLFARWPFWGLTFCVLALRSLAFRALALSWPRFSRAGTFAASLFVCRHFRGLALHALALRSLAFRALALSRPRFTRTGTSRPRFSRAGSFASSLFARWLLRSLAFRTSAVSANLDLHDFSLGELSVPQTPTTPSNSSSLALRALPLHALILSACLRRPAFACLFSTRWMELHSGVQGLRAGHVVEIFRQGIPDGLVEGFVNSKKILGRDCHHHHLALIITRYSHLFLINTHSPPPISPPICWIRACAIDVIDGV